MTDIKGKIKSLKIEFGVIYLTKKFDLVLVSPIIPPDCILYNRAGSRPEGNKEQTKNKKLKRTNLTINNFDDKRLVRHIDKATFYEPLFKFYNISKKKIELIEDIQKLKSFGYGRIIDGQTLPSMVVGHNLCFNKKTFYKVGGFSTKFKGWGMEDTYFGAKAIVQGSFIIPVTTCGVFHLKHPPRSGNYQKKLEEYKKNIKTYKFLLNQYEN